MLVPAIRRSNVPYNLRRIAACVGYRDDTRARIARECRNVESDLLLPVSLQTFPARRIYSTESESRSRVSLPMLVEGAREVTPSLLTPFKLLYLSLFKIVPYIDKEFDVSEFLKGAQYATSVISKALANKDFDSLHGLVAEDTIEVLRDRVETLSPDQRQLIHLNENDVLFYVLSDIEATRGNEHSIQITIISHYIQGFGERKHMTARELLEFTKSCGHLVCNYIFMRKYVNNVGGPWMATFVNHYSVSL